MKNTYTATLALITILNLSSCSARQTTPSAVTTTRQQTTEKEIHAPYGTEVDFSDLVKKHGSEDGAIAEILRADMVVLDFFATWCPPCKNLAPNFASAAQTVPTVLFVKIDAEKFANIRSRYAVRSYPTLVFLHKGAKISAVSGFRSQKVLVDETKAAFKL
ncbi:MAG: thioredoxin family protein [Candidatus Dependentiae bacterium]|jgi:thiol-disulfide isomerase/thioredoxin|nr:thioredoxin family protein [Candidatus Dependentiae bacterium]